MAQAAEIAVDSRGRITIAKPLRAKLGLAEGMRLLVEEEADGSVILLPEPDDEVDLAWEGRILVARLRIPEIAEDIVDQEREQRLAELERRASR